MRLNQSKKQTIYRMFARGENCERVAEAMNLSLHHMKNRYLQYLGLPLEKKMRLTLLPESVTNRAHRLADDIKDIERIDALLPSADQKTLVSLLDIKRKIKERMMKDSLLTPDAPPGDADDALDNEIDECYKKIFGDTDQN
jgi:hypothetical protein